MSFLIGMCVLVGLCVFGSQAFAPRLARLHPGVRQSLRVMPAFIVLVVIISNLAGLDFAALKNSKEVLPSGYFLVLWIVMGIGGVVVWATKKKRRGDNLRSKVILLYLFWLGFSVFSVPFLILSRHAFR